MEYVSKYAGCRNAVILGFCCSFANRVYREKPEMVIDLLKDSLEATLSRKDHKYQWLKLTDDKTVTLYGNIKWGALPDLEEREKVTLLKTLEIDGKTYLIAKARNFREKEDNEFPGCYIYELLPQLADDGTFKWKDDLRHGTKEAVIKFFDWEYACTAKYEKDGSCTVDIDCRYIKLDNRHSNKVTVSTITVKHNPSNQILLEAIDKWQNEMKESLNYSFSKKCLTF